MIATLTAYHSSSYTHPFVEYIESTSLILLEKFSVLLLLVENDTDAYLLPLGKIGSDREDLSDDILAYQNNSFDELNGMPVNLLIPIANGHATSGKKK